MIESKPVQMETSSTVILSLLSECSLAWSKAWIGCELGLGLICLRAAQEREMFYGFWIPCRKFVAKCKSL